MGGAIYEQAIAPALNSDEEEKFEDPAVEEPNDKTTPDGGYFPDRDLPRDDSGNPIPDVDYPHTQLGTRSGRTGDYPQAREFDENGNPVRDIDFTDHGRADHENPHEHVYTPNETGGTPNRGSPEPLKYP